MSLVKYLQYPWFFKIIQRLKPLWQNTELGTFWGQSNPILTSQSYDDLLYTSITVVEINSSYRGDFCNKTSAVTSLSHGFCYNEQIPTPLFTETSLGQTEGSCMKEKKTHRG